MTAAARLLARPEIGHGPIELIFTPDEETGKGMNLFPLERLRSKACYTIDGGKAGEIEAECFNAYSVKAEFKGKAIHIGAARGKLANAVAMAASFVSMLPRSEAPESTDGWYGYYCPLEISGGLESAAVELFLRDFSQAGMESRIAAVRAIAAAVEAQFPLGSVALTVAKQYVNMREKLDERPEVLERLMEAARRAGAEPVIKPIRGGTDGARLTEMGVPDPQCVHGRLQLPQPLRVGLPRRDGPRGRYAHRARAAVGFVAFDRHRRAVLRFPLFHVQRSADERGHQVTQRACGHSVKMPKQKPGPRGPGFEVLQSVDAVRKSLRRPPRGASASARSCRDQPVRGVLLGALARLVALVQSSTFLSSSKASPNRLLASSSWIRNSSAERVRFSRRWIAALA